MSEIATAINKLCGTVNELRAENARLEAENADLRSGEYLVRVIEERERLRNALGEMVRAVCGETGFANAVRFVSGKAYPWPALDIAEQTAINALEAKL